LKQKEIDEDLAIEQWQREKDAKEAERERQWAAKEAQKAALQKRMLVSQVKAMDNRDQIEELRMRRAFEAQERKQREIELEKARQWSGLELIASEVRHFCASQSTLSLLRCCVDGAPTPPHAHAAVAYSFAHERHTPASFPHTRLSLPHIHLLRRTSRPRR
jgi:hypothetical protein